MEELTLGAEITVVTTDGRQRLYRVGEQLRVPLDDIRLLYPTSGERITLVSCIGVKVIRDGTPTREDPLGAMALPVG